MNRSFQNLRNKTQENIINKYKSKNYFERFTKLNIYTYTRPSEKKINLGCKPSDVYTLFNGNTSTTKKTLGKEENTPVLPEDVTIDQSTLQYYTILALQDFYYNYYVPLSEENKSLKDNLAMMQTMLIHNKKKNDQRFEVISKNIETLAQHINEL